MSVKSSDNTDELEKIDLRLIALEQERSALLLKREKLVGALNIDAVVVHQTSSAQEKMRTVFLLTLRLNLFLTNGRCCQIPLK